MSVFRKPEPQASEMSGFKKPKPDQSKLLQRYVVGALAAAIVVVGGGYYLVEYRAQRAVEEAGRKQKEAKAELEGIILQACRRSVLAQMRDPDSASFMEETVTSFDLYETALVIGKAIGQNAFGARLTRKYMCDFHIREGAKARVLGE